MANRQVTIATFTPRTGVPGPYGIAPRIIVIKYIFLDTVGTEVIIDSSEVNADERAVVLSLLISSTESTASADNTRFQNQQDNSEIAIISPYRGGLVATTPALNTNFPIVVNKANGFGLLLENLGGGAGTHAILHAAAVPGSQFS
jgi:hypothetical protein